VTPFAWDEPKSLADALALLDPEDPGVRVIAGGTALMLMMKSGVFAPSRLVSLAHIEPHYSEITVEPSGALSIGAMASLSDLENSAAVARGFPVITHALRTLSNVRVRNVARVGGALAHGDPHMDLPPLLASLGARVSITGPNGARELAVEDLYAGYYETVLEKDELIASVHVPPLGARKTAYVKVTSRSADDWPALNLGLSLEMAGEIIQSARLIVSAATQTPTRLHDAEKVLAGARPDAAVLARAGEAAAAEISVLADAHGSSGYKKALLRVYLGRGVRRALGEGAA
jgi:carbon-monoxide dehydrogenase medium subunit